MATKAAPLRTPAKPSAGLPNQTLYCTNLPDKLRKHDLRLSLYTLFSTYGTVLDIVAMKTEKMRGQAHIVFKDVQASTQAIRALQGFEFFGKPMKITYAKGTSDVIAKLRGTYNISVAAPGQTSNMSTDLQKSIFSGPPGVANLPPNPCRDPNGTTQGIKRPREEESDGGEAPMDEDSDVPMEGSSDED